MTMKTSFNLWPFCTFPSILPAYTIEYALDTIARVGYDAVEICAAVPHAWPPYMTDQDRQRIKRHLEQTKLSVSSICPGLAGPNGLNPASVNDAERQAAVQHYRDCVDLAEAWGAPVVLYVAGWIVHGTPYQQAWDQATRTIRDIAPYALERGVRVAVEPTSRDTNLIDTQHQAIALADAAESDGAGLMFDTYHVAFRRDVSTDYVYDMAPRLIHTHISDTERLPPGHGEIDFDPIVRALQAVGYSGYLCLEAGIGARNVDPESFARKSLEALQRLMEAK